jgi:hypothetical protein
MDDKLLQDIKFNCDVSDAQFWGYYSVCGLLMRYRELFRSERGLGFRDEIKRDEIGAWIGQKEQQWPYLEQQPFRELVIDDVRYDAFDTVGINRKLNASGLVYGAGYGMYFKPSFFLAELRSVREAAGLTVLTSGKELCRDLFTSPAMLREKTVFIRLEPLAALLQYKYGELQMRGNALLEQAFTAYGIPPRALVDDTLEQRIAAAAERYAEIVLLHEIGEAHEDSSEWKDILAVAAGDRRMEHYLRAVKDLLADTSDHGPYKTIIDGHDRGALGLTNALTEGFRKHLFPEMNEACAALAAGGTWDGVEQARAAGLTRFRGLRDEIVARFYEMDGDAERFRAAVNRMIAE